MARRLSSIDLDQADTSFVAFQTLREGASNGACVSLVIVTNRGSTGALIRLALVDSWGGSQEPREYLMYDHLVESGNWVTLQYDLPMGPAQSLVVQSSETDVSVQVFGEEELK